MSKITLTDLVNLQNENTAVNAINTNNAILEAALDNTLSRNGISPNQMGANLDMNSNQILNLPIPGNPTSPVRLQDILAGISTTNAPTGTSGHTVPFLDGNNTWSGTQTFNPVPVYSVPANTVQGNNTGAPANVASLTQTQLTAMVNPFTSGLSGTVPASGGGTSTFLRADGSFASTGWTNTRLAKTANYTVVNADRGSTIALGGSAFYTLTVSAAGGYDVNFAILVTNEDTTRGKTIACNGLSSFILYPGQSCFIFNQNNNWKVNPSSQRWLKTSASLFVDSVNGSNSNDGLVSGAGGAFATIAQAVSVLMTNVDCVNSPPTINIAAGTYIESVTCQGQLTGYNFLNFVGAGSASVTWKPGASGFCLLVGDNAEALISGIKFDNTSGTNNAIGISVHQDGVIDVSTDVNFGSFPTTGSSRHINSDLGGFINLPANYTISGVASWHINAGPGTVITQASGGTITFTGTYTIALLYRFQGTSMTFAGVVTYTLGTVTVTSGYSADFLSFLALNGTTVAGGAGTTAHGSQVA